MSGAIMEVTYLPATIKADFDELERQAADYVAMYDGVDLEHATDEDESGIRKCRADLNAKRKELDERRKAIKREYNKPLDEFEARVKGVQDILGGGIARFDAALERIKEARQGARFELLDDTYHDAAPILVPLVGIEAFIEKDPSLMHKATTDKQAVARLLDMVEQLAADQAALEAMELPHKEEAEVALFKCLDLSAAIQASIDAVKDEERRRAEQEAVAAMKAEQAALGNPLPEAPLTAALTAPQERCDISVVFLDVTEEDINAITGFCRERGIHGSIRRLA